MVKTIVCWKDLELIWSRRICKSCELSQVERVRNQDRVWQWPEHPRNYQITSGVPLQAFGRFWQLFLISPVSPFPYPSAQLSSFLPAEAPGGQLSLQDSFQSLRSGLPSVS